MNQVRKSAALIVTLLLPGAVYAQTAAPSAPAQPPAANPAQPPAITPAQQFPQTPIPQPSAKTPPTPLPDKAPDTAVTNVKKEDIKDTNVFRDNGNVPGQPLSTDPTTIRTLDDALAVAFQRNPNILLTQERAVRTNKIVDQILALKKPQISVTGTYSRLLNSNASAGNVTGATPSSIQNPFAVGLNNAAPGSSPISLSSSGSGSAVTSTSSAGGATSSTTVGATGSGAGGASTSTSGGSATGTSVGGQTRSAQNSSAQTRQTDPTDPTTPTDPTDPTTPTTPSTGNNGNVQSFVNSPNLNQISARFSLTQLIDITGLVKTAEQIGDLGKALSRLELARTRQDVALSIKNGYYNVLRSLAFVRVNEAAVAQSQELLRVTQAQLTAGVASQFDVLRAQTQLDNNRQALISSRNQVSISKNSFANSLGIDPSTPVDPQPLDTPAVPDLNEEALIQTAFTQRPEYLQADVNIILAQRNIRLARRNLEPYLNAGINGNYGATSNSFGQDRGTASIGLGLTIPLYDGGSTKAQVQSARSDERGALVQKDQFARGIKAEVQQSIVAVRDADERRTAIALTVQQAQEALRLANVRFQAGVGTQLDVNDAQTALTQAEYNQVNAQYDFLGALARLQRSIGTPQ